MILLTALGGLVTVLLLAWAGGALAVAAWCVAVWGCRRYRRRRT